MMHSGDNLLFKWQTSVFILVYKVLDNISSFQYCEAMNKDWGKFNEGDQWCPMITREQCKKWGQYDLRLSQKMGHSYMHCIVECVIKQQQSKIWQSNPAVSVWMLMS